MERPAKASKSKRLKLLQHSLLLAFVGVCCLMIILTLIFAFSEEDTSSFEQKQVPVYLAPTPTRGG
jgi:hypothetical protein